MVTESAALTFNLNKKSYLKMKPYPHSPFEVIANHPCICITFITAFVTLIALNMLEKIAKANRERRKIEYRELKELQEKEKRENEYGQ